MPDRAIGIDFSGAKDAGRKIWIATGVVAGSRLIVSDCRQAKDLFRTAQRDACMEGLRQFIAAQSACAIGLDFPFGLPKSVVKANTWEEFALSFRHYYSSPDEFRKACRAETEGREDRRETDREAQTPFSPYNLRLYRQTYYGIRDVLAPLVRAGLACVLPMQALAPSLPWLLEICPASTLTRMGLRRPYKGRGSDRSANRVLILKALEATGTLVIESPALRATIVGDPSGDALDSAIATLATHKAVHSSALPAELGPDPSNVEGRVYV